MSANVSLARELTVGATTEPIVAWRAWALTGHRDGTELLHGAPNVDCSCGLHGTHDVEILRRTRCPAVLGRVAFWGRVIEHELGYRAQFGYPQRLTLVCQFCFWLWGPHGTRPAVVGWFQRDELIPFCWPHLEQAQRYGMEPRRLLPADEVDLRLRETYAVDLLAF